MWQSASLSERWERTLESNTENVNDFRELTKGNNLTRRVMTRGTRRGAAGGAERVSASRHVVRTPKQTDSPAARAPAGPARDDPISGRLARAATGVSYDASEGVTVSPGGTRRLWLVESARAPRSPGVATVAAVNGASSARADGVGARRGASVGTDQPDADKGPAFSHLLRQNDRLAKRLRAAHEHLRRAFGPGRDAQYVTSALRVKSGAQALKCVAEAMPIGDALLANWDAAWGLHMRHLTRGKERAERDPRARAPDGARA